MVGVKCSENTPKNAVASTGQAQLRPFTPLASETSPSGPLGSRLATNLRECLRSFHRRGSDTFLKHLPLP